MSGAQSVTRAQVLGCRVASLQLDREAGGIADAAVLDMGVQDTGPDGGSWALVVRGVDVSKLSGGKLATFWTIRGAPHLYRHGDLPGVAAAVEPFSDADAGKRIFDAAKPLKAAGIRNLAALDAVAAAMRSVVTKPMVKGEIPFRLAALRAGLELPGGTSPPVLRRIPRFERAATTPERHDVTSTGSPRVGGRARVCSTCSCKQETGHCWSRTRRGRRRCGPFSADPAP